MIAEICDGRHRHHRGGADDPAVRRAGDRRRAARPAADSPAAGGDGLRERHQRHRRADRVRPRAGARRRRLGRRCRRRRSSPTPRSTGSCPTRPPRQGLDVTVETYFEWAIERPPFDGKEPTIPDATWVDDLAPYIERKLFTVNTGHASTAYHGTSRAFSKLSDALADDEVRAKVEGVLAETKQLLVDKHEFAPEAQQAYVDKILGRFANPYLPDTVDRVGRQPLRKLSRTERLIGPAAELAALGERPEFLLATVEAALVVRCPGGSGKRRAEEVAGDPDAGRGDHPDHRPAARRAAVRRRAGDRGTQGRRAACADRLTSRTCRADRAEP